MNELKEYTILIPHAYTASEWIYSHMLAQFLNENEHGASVTSMGTGVGKPIFFRNSDGLEGNRYAMHDMHLSAASSYGYEKALDEFKKLFDEGVLPEDMVFSGDAAESFDEPTVYTLKRSGDVRVMYNNVFNHIYKPDKINTPNLSSGPIPLRHMMERELFEAYRPDVLCLQEYQRWFREGWEGSPAMTDYLGELGYSEAVPQTPNGMPNATPVFYLADRLELIECGFHLYGGDNDNGTKSVTWARFEVKASGKRFVAMSTHFMWGAPRLTREEAAAVRSSNAREALALISEVAGDAPVIFGGDFNCNSKEDAWLLMADSGMSYAKSVAERCNASCGWKNYAIYDSDTNVHVTVPIPHDGNGIDHVFVKGGMKVETFMTVTDRFALLSTDHCPKFADLTLL